MSKVNKAEEIAKLLEQGRSVKTIKKLAKASESYIYMIKKQMEVYMAKEKLGEAAQEAEAETTTIRPSYNPEAGEFIVVEGAKSAQEVDAILNERGSNYGSYMQSASTAIRIKSAMHDAIFSNGLEVFPDQMLSLDMIAVKISRIVNGNPAHRDSWLDIAGYATLVADRLQGKAR